MTGSEFKFLRRVRIHDGECGAVARALHHAAQKVALVRNEQSLISDECIPLRQAGSEKASDSTFNERKQMSTKTSIKRIALVAVSALGFGLMSVVPASATVPATAVPTATTPTITVAVGSVASTTVAMAAADSVGHVWTLTAANVTKPNQAAPAADTVANGATSGKFILSSVGATAPFYVTGTAAASGKAVVTHTAAGEITVTGNAAGDQASTNSIVGTFSFMPAHAGTYTFSLTSNATTAGVGTVTVVALPSTTSGSAITATQSSATGISSDTNTITVSRTTGSATDGQILGQFTVSADGTDAPLTTVFGKVAGTADLAAVTAGGSVATPTFAVARTNLAAGSYTIRFWVDANSNGTYESSETSTTASFTVAGALDSISVSVNNPIRSNVAGHKVFTVTATLSDALGAASAGTIYVSESNSTGTADAATTYTDIVNDTQLARVGTTNTYVGTFNIDTDAAAATGSNLVYISVANATDLTLSTTKVGVASIRLVRFADLAATGTVMEAFDAVGIGDFTTAAGAVSATRDSLTATADADGAITVDPAITSITYTGTAAAGQAGEYIYLSTTPAVGNSATCAPTAGSYVPVLADLSFTYTVATTCIDAEGYTAKFTGSNDAQIVVTYDDPAPRWSTAPGGSYTALVGSSNSIVGTLTDSYGRVLSSKAVTAVVTGRNPATIALTTDASGMVTWSGKDAYTGLLTTDSVVFNYNYTNSLGTNSVASSTARVITYAATLAAVGSVTVVDDEADNAMDIDQVGSATTTAANLVTYTATVKTATGAPIGSGVLVTCVGNDGDKFYGSASGVTTSTSNGQVTVNVYRHKVGYSTITCSANGVSSTPSSDVFWTNTDAQARNVTLSAAQKVTAANTATVTATVTDRWGNPIYSGVGVTFTISGVGRLQTGSSIATAIQTNTAGTAQIQVTSNELETGVMTVGASITGGQELNAAGVVGTVTGVTGATAGNATASTTVTFEKSTAVSTADALLELAKAIGTGNSANAAADAALEAIDAANAATDAANLAAEAADAATVAAEEARDAADAATAAVEALASEVATLVAALKAQITTLANTVAKIAKRVKA